MTTTDLSTKIDTKIYDYKNTQNTKALFLKGRSIIRGYPPFAGF